MKRSLLIAAAAVILLALLVPLFSAPAANLGPRDLPLVVAGPPPAAQAAAARLPAGFAVTVVPDAAAADAAIRDREAYGALILGPAGPAVHVASAASPAVAAALTQAAGTLGATAVVDVVPAGPRAAAFAAGFLPLAMAAMAAGVLLVLGAAGRAARLTGVVTFAALAGLAGAAVLNLWLDVVPGGYWPVAGVIALLCGAIAATMSGLGAALGRAGLGLGAVTVFLVGNALSAAGSAPELLPQPWGEVGQWLPIGAGATLLRSVAYFDGAGGGRAALILAGYLVLGLALVAAARPRAAGPAATPERELVAA